MNRTITCILILCLFSGCIKRKLEPGEYVRYIKNPKKGIFVEKTIGEYVFGLQYKPLDYVALLEQRGDSVLNNKDFKADKEKMKNSQHFTFTIRTREGKSVLKQDIVDEKELYDRINYFSYVMQEDFKLVEGKDTLKCTFYHFERTYDLSPYLTFIVEFEQSKKKNRANKLFIYEDRILKTGTVKIMIKSGSIKRIPVLKIH